MDRIQLIRELDEYRTAFEEERYFIPRFISLLRNFKDCYSRSLLTGHITASAWILNNNFTHALLVHHRKLNRWLQPGGHTDGDEDVIAAALREANEETGLTMKFLENQPFFDIDIHQIPANGRIQAHFHYDIRYLFTADKSLPIAVSHESHDVRWFALDEITEIAPDNKSILRMVAKSGVTTHS